MQQVLSMLLHRKASNASAEYFRGAHFTITVPASIEMQVDGSAVELKDHVRKSDWAALSEAGKASEVMVKYRFDAMPGALRVAIPNTYNDALFEESGDSAKTETAEVPEAVGEEIQQQADAIVAERPRTSQHSLRNRSRRSWIKGGK